MNKVAVECWKYDESYRRRDQREMCVTCEFESVLYAWGKMKEEMGMRPLPIMSEKEREWVYLNFVVQNASCACVCLYVRILFIQDAVSLRFGSNSIVGNFSYEYETKNRHHHHTALLALAKGDANKYTHMNVNVDAWKMFFFFVSFSQQKCVQ